MPVTIYHNPRCNTSRRTLALLREKGVEPTIIEYLASPSPRRQTDNSSFEYINGLRSKEGKVRASREVSVGSVLRLAPSSTIADNCRRA
jgi:hypothetical protein